MGKKRVRDMDVAIGRRVRTKRIEMGITQQTLADHLQVAFQQVQKYEKGMNRISSGTLYEIAKVLCADIAYFFVCGNNEESTHPTNNVAGVATGRVKAAHDSAPVEGAELDMLIGYYKRISSQKARRGVLKLVRDLAD